MVNIPRDTVLTLCDGSQGRVNAAFGIGERSGVGGMTCVVQTVSAWSGVPIDHAVMADFRGFVDIVDAIGGIEMYLEEPLFGTVAPTSTSRPAARSWTGRTPWRSSGPGRSTATSGVSAGNSGSWWSCATRCARTAC
jgi:anionic cell wall polymer biosynthesis LytR-Cps2A-Psr (LCP) family protein